MAIIFGTKADGSTGQLDHDEFANMIYRKSGSRAELKNCGVCATHIEDMSTTAGQGGITTKFAGKTVFHISSGKRSSTTGASVFFTLDSESSDNLVAGLVGVGWHDGTSDHEYRLDWGKGAPFFTGRVFDSAQQFQKSADHPHKGKRNEDGFRKFPITP